MSDDAPSAPVQPGLEIDLALSFQPAWVKESPSPEKTARLADRFQDARDRTRNPKEPRRGDARSERPARGAGNKPRRDDKRARNREDSRRNTAPRPDPILEGWELSIVTDDRITEGLARQVRSTAVAYPLFEMAQLVLEKSERYRVALRRKDGAPLFLVPTDGSVWASEREATTHLLSQHLEKFYRRDQVATEPPKGNYPCVAVCGMSDTVIGPPNYHDYQDRLRKLHADRFAALPFEVFKSRVRMVRDEALIQKWKDERSAKDEFHPLQVAEGEEPVKLASLAEVERHFQTHYAPGAIVPAGDRVEVPGPAILHSSTPSARALARRTVDELRRFPLPFAHTLGQALSARGLSLFKDPGNITHVSIARPRHLDRAVTPLSEGLSGILTYLEEHPKTPREERRKALAALRPAPEGAEAERDAAAARDLAWLLHEGYVVDYARRGLEIVRRAKSRPEQSQ